MSTSPNNDQSSNISSSDDMFEENAKQQEQQQQQLSSSQSLDQKMTTSDVRCNEETIIKSHKQKTRNIVCSEKTIITSHKQKRRNSYDSTDSNNKIKSVLKKESMRRFSNEFARSDMNNSKRSVDSAVSFNLTHNNEEEEENPMHNSKQSSVSFQDAVENIENNDGNNDGDNFNDNEDVNIGEIDVSNNNNNNDNNNNSDRNKNQRDIAHSYRKSMVKGLQQLSFVSTEDRTIFNKLLRFLNNLRIGCGIIVNNRRVQLFIVILIAINSIMMGIATFDFVEDNKSIHDAFELVDKIFLIIFTIELSFQGVYHGYRLILDGWLVFDLIVIVMSWTFAEAQIIRAFRIFRAFRLITRVKVMKNLIIALFNVMPRMGAIALLLFLIFYIFAVMFTQLFKDLWHDGQTEEDYFSRMDATYLTLYQLMTLDNWADITRQVIAVYKWSWAPIVAFVVITGFVVVNLIIAVICDAVAALSEEDKNKFGGVMDDASSFSGFDEQGNYVSYHSSHFGVSLNDQIQLIEERVSDLAQMQHDNMLILKQLVKQIQTNKQQHQQRDSNNNDNDRKKIPSPTSSHTATGVNDSKSAGHAENESENHLNIHTT